MAVYSGKTKLIRIHKHHPANQSVENQEVAVKLNQNNKIRLYIMMIAFLGSVVFLVFLSINFWVAKKNETHILDMQVRQFPIIEELTQLKKDADQLREALSNAITFENHFLIVDAIDSAPAIEDRIKRIENLAGQENRNTRAIRAYLAAYIRQATELAEGLVDNPDNLSAFEKKAGLTHKAFTILNRTINQYLAETQTQYSSNLDKINQALNLSNIAAAAIGLVLIIGLIILTWFITNMVMRAIEKADNLKESFLTTISHELRTPMNGIIGALSLLKRSDLNDQQRDLINIANNASGTMIKAVDDILTFTDLMSGEPKLSMSIFTIDEWMSDLIKVARSHCADKHLSFIEDIDLTAELIESDKNKLTSVCRHLLENAVKYTSDGTIHLSISHQKQSVPEDSGTITVQVEDNGPGMNKELMQNIFKPFQQAEGGFKRKHQGIGIGLAMSNAIVSSLGGKLHLINKSEGKGLIAHFSIPCQFAERPTVEAPQQTQINLDKLPHSPSVLIVEDNKVNQVILNKLVKKMNCTTLLAENGKEGVEQVCNNNIDIILMDCQMPIMDGFEATEAIRKLENSKSKIPIVAVTANARDADKARCFEVGMNGFLGKPVDFRSVKQAIEDHLEQH